MTEHPCKGMTKAEIAAFEAIAVNRPPHCSKRTLDKLLSRGVIEKYEKKPQPGWAVQLAFLLRTVELMTAVVAILALLLGTWARDRH